MEIRLEQELVERARDGDMAAFQQLYKAYSTVIYHRVIRPRVTIDADADDVLVETFVSALKALPAFEWRGKSFGGFLARIAINKCHDLGRRTGRFQRTVARLVHYEPNEPPRPDERISRLTDRRAAKDEVARVFSLLNPRYKEVLQLRFIEGQARQDCADALGLKLGTFDVLLLRATRAFRAAWHTEFGGGES